MNRIHLSVTHRIPRPRPIAGMLLAAALPLLAATAQAQSGPLRGMDAYAERAMRDWRVPGMAMAVVKDDSVVYQRGFGTRTAGRDEPVDTHTSFAMASTTKAFTATAVAMLVDEGKLRWDDPVSLHLPAYRVDAAPGLASQLTVRDLLSHRTGLPAADVLWYASGYSSDEILRRMRFVRPAAAPRERFEYNNVGYLLAGMIVERAGGMPWAEFVRTRILSPLGMNETLTGSTGLDTRGNSATPHVQLRDTIRPIRYRDFDNIGPAGAMNSSVSDMARWIRLQLAGGRTPGGQALVSEAGLRETWTPQILIPAAQANPATRRAGPSFTAYGMGWFVQDYRGRRVVMHTGSIDGMSALVALVPEERLGMVIYLNLDHAELRHALVYRVIDAYLGGPPRDWSAGMRQVFPPSAEQEREAEAWLGAAHAAGTRPSLPLEAYAGTFADPDSLAPPVTVSVREGRLVATMGAGATGELEHWHYDVFRVRWADLAMGEDFPTYTIGVEGKANWLMLGGRVLGRVPEEPSAAQQ
jgi:CubicO group peptidase (beta-lactamase class C family)